MMNLRKTIIAGITCSLLPLVSQAAPDFYGRAWLGLSHSDSGLLSDRKENGAYLENYASFIGVKGKEKLNDNINIVYVMEFGNNGGYFDTSSLFKSRNTYLGVESQLGTLVFGRNDTVFKKTEGKVDLFNITSSDMAKIIAGNDRLGDSATYYSPKWYGVQLGVSYQFADNLPEQNGSNGNYALSLTAGDAKLKQQAWYLALAYADSLNALDAVRAVAGARLAGAKLGFMYQHSESQKYQNLSGNSLLASMEIPWQQYSFKAQYLYDNSGNGKVVSSLADKASVTDASSWQASLGLDYRASKSTTFSLITTYLDGDFTDAGGYTEYDDKLMTLAMKHMF
ncbi:porin [Shewanella algae]|uniref:porin n=1 Tax=Shewanella algae TaxID=38313 RepID=UPI0031F56AA1